MLVLMTRGVSIQRQLDLGKYVHSSRFAKFMGYDWVDVNGVYCYWQFIGVIVENFIETFISRCLPRSLKM